MAQDYKNAIKAEISNLALNYPNRVIRASTDWNVVTIGRLQIENLNWRWQPEMSNDINTYLMYSPHDWRSPAPWNRFSGNFVITKYGLSYREKPLTLASYKPLWAPGTKPDQQAEIMAKEMKRMEKEGAKKCENGIEIVPETPLWEIVDTLATKARNTFRTSMGEKVKDLDARHVSYDGEKLWDAGVRCTAEIAAIVKILGTQIAR